MPCSLAGPMLDLLTTGDSSGSNDGLFLGCFYRFEETPLAHFKGEVVVLRFKSEGACHPAAARIHLIHFEAAQLFEAVYQWPRSDMSLLMTMTVQQYSSVPLIGGTPSTGLAHLYEPLFEHERVSCHSLNCFAL